ncbi:MAG: hypothetical protein EA001_03170 [Oscillatoriales cyanobacterium]|nr:MAG: hypothetical protein EA001_03170 [Oscillatoriales cyanobacterium]
MTDRLPMLPSSSVHRPYPAGLPLHYQAAGRSRRFWWSCGLAALGLHVVALVGLGGAGASSGGATVPVPITRVVLPAETGQTGQPVGQPTGILPDRPPTPPTPPTPPAAVPQGPLRPLPQLRQLDPSQLAGGGPAPAVPFDGGATDAAPFPDQPINPDPIDPNMPPDYGTPGLTAPPPPLGGPGPDSGGRPPANDPSSGSGNSTQRPGGGGLAVAVVGLVLIPPGDGGDAIQGGDLSRSPELQSAPPSLNLDRYPELASWAGRTVDLKLAVMADGSVGFAGILTPGLSAAAEQGLQSQIAQLRFSPAVTTAGQAISVYLRLTIRLG